MRPLRSVDQNDFAVAAWLDEGRERDLPLEPSDARTVLVSGRYASLRALARRDLTEDIELALLARSDPSINKVLAANPDVSSSTRSALWDCPDALPALATRADLTPDELEQLAYHYVSSVLIPLARNPLAAAHLELITSGPGRERVLRASSANPALPADLQRARSKDPLHHYDLATNPALDPDAARRVHAHARHPASGGVLAESNDVLRALASNPSTPEDVLLELAARPAFTAGDGVHERLVSREHVSPLLAHELMRSADASLRPALLRNPSLEPGFLLEMCASWADPASYPGLVNPRFPLDALATVLSEHGGHVAGAFLRARHHAPWEVSVEALRLVAPHVPDHYAEKFSATYSQALEDPLELPPLFLRAAAPFVFAELTLDLDLDTLVGLMRSWAGTTGELLETARELGPAEALTP